MEKSRVFISPSQYLQGPGMIEKLGQCVQRFGKRALLIGTKEDISRVATQLNETSLDYGVELVATNFSGEITKTEVARLRTLAQKESCDCIVGLGGGRALDVAKGVSLGEKLILVPTVASSDAPTSIAAVLYNEDGSLDGYTYGRQNPAVVLVDTAIILQAPARFLTAGMGDALTTYYEAVSTFSSGGLTQAALVTKTRSARPTLAAMAIARECLQTILTQGAAAKTACEEGQLTAAFEDVIEANTLLSGIGFESGGLSAAHAIHDGLTIIAETQRSLHGEKVAFCLLAQFVLTDAPADRWTEVLGFMSTVGLPITLAEIGITEIVYEQLLAVGELACAAHEPMKNLGFPVTKEMVAAAMITADERGRAFKEKGL